MTEHLPIFIDPPEILVQHVRRMDMREFLRMSKKLSRQGMADEVFLYSTESHFYVESPIQRCTWPLDGDWSGCVSIGTDLILPFWNSLPKGERLPIRYERGWLSLGTLALGRAVWQPKYDPQWMIR